MNTEIKARGVTTSTWDTIFGSLIRIDGKVFIFPYNANIRCIGRYGNDHFGEISQVGNDYINEVYANSVHLFTGLRDKNKVEIYQSDFVKDSEEIYLVCFGEWEYDTYSFIGWYLKNKSGSFGLSSKDCEQFEVIGNLYQNPELMPL